MVDLAVVLVVVRATRRHGPGSDDQSRRRMDVDDPVLHQPRKGPVKPSGNPRLHHSPSPQVPGVQRILPGSLFRG